MSLHERDSIMNKSIELNGITYIRKPMIMEDLGIRDTSESFKLHNAVYG
jgi:hypothetical protein